MESCRSKNNQVLPPPKFPWLLFSPPTCAFVFFVAIASICSFSSMNSFLFSTHAHLTIEKARRPFMEKKMENNSPALQKKKNKQTKNLRLDEITGFSHLLSLLILILSLHHYMFSCFAVLLLNALLSWLDF
jgi:hypothetical protein